MEKASTALAQAFAREKARAVMPSLCLAMLSRLVRLKIAPANLVIIEGGRPADRGWKPTA